MNFPQVQGQLSEGHSVSLLLKKGPPGSTEALPVEPDEAIGGQVTFARSVHQNLQEVVKLADQKAAAIVAAETVVAALLGSNLIDKFKDKPSVALLLVGGLTLAFTVLAAGSALGVLLPRFPGARHVQAPPSAPRLMWASDIARYASSPGDYCRALVRVTPSAELGDLAFENLKIAWILDRKFLWMKWAIRLLAMAILGWASTLVVIVRGG